MKLYILLSFFFLVKGFNWNNKSWRTKKVNQIPDYDDLEKLKLVENELSKKPPLIFAGECDNLQYELAKISIGNGFLLMGGDCAETFKDFSTERIRDNYRLLLQMGMILTYGCGLPVTKIGRVAGQFAKPRSDEYEIINGSKILTYRGDIINDINNRKPNPTNMLKAYYQSVQTLNLLRGFSYGGYASLKRIHNWNLDFIENTIIGYKYKILADKVTKSLNFMNGLGININDDIFKNTNIYTSHECLLLNYEEALTRNDSRNNKPYDCSGHLLWLGERTKQIDGAHVEFMRGINNPIGIKISHLIKPIELVALINILNPDNIAGKIVLITRMGFSNLRIYLPDLIRIIQSSGLNVVWCCDPMHGNTIKTENGLKTRIFENIKNEVKDFFYIHKQMGTFPGGLHLELTSEYVTECVDDNLLINDLDKKYLSTCDPRLNGLQALELAFIVSEIMNN